MRKREPRSAYDGASYPHLESDVTRRSALRRLGGLGGLLLVGVSPGLGPVVARALELGRDGWLADIPSGGELRELDHGGHWIAYRVVLEVENIGIADCVLESESEIIQEVDTYLLERQLIDIESEALRPEIEEAVIGIIAGVCPAPGPADDDDSADEPEDVTHGYTLVQLDLYRLEDEIELAGDVAQPTCCPMLPRR